MHKVYDEYPNRAARRRVWLSTIEAWRQSNLSAKVFCEQEQIKEADLRRWNYRLGKLQHKKTPSRVKTTHPSPIAFAALQLTPATPAALPGQGYIDLLLGTNYRLRCYQHSDEALLVRLLGTLQRLFPC